MHVAALDGRHIEVRRRWMPWRLRKRQIEPGFSPFDFLSGADDLAGVAIGLVVGIVLFLFGGIVLTLAIFASEALLLILLLVPVIVGLRTFWVLPWVIEARIREIAGAFERGEDPFVSR